ncbi:MAG: hypothetical protein EOO38_32640 [Cytophagaceae bacterium]|nr:MAG: hypothetical protein EOO38_32640 [Cytophagaceae bacterium]
MPTESLPDVLTRLSDRGFNDQCRADAQGIHFLRGQAVFAPEDLIVDDVIRLEGTSAPDEQIAIYALISPDGNLRGSYTVPHGTDEDRHDTDAILRLQPKAESDDASSQAQPLQQQF